MGQANSKINKICTSADFIKKLVLLYSQDCDKANVNQYIIPNTHKTLTQVPMSPQIRYLIYHMINMRFSTDVLNVFAYKIGGLYDSYPMIYCLNTEHINTSVLWYHILNNKRLWIKLYKRPNNRVLMNKLVEEYRLTIRNLIQDFTRLFPAICRIIIDYCKFVYTNPLFL